MSYALGIDFGGTGIKGGLVDCESGGLVSERVKYATPEGAHPRDVLDTVTQIIADIGGDGSEPLGICYPGVVSHGITKSAANVSLEWIGFEAQKVFEESLQRTLVFVNDADAAACAEVQFGAAQGREGLVMMITLGTGIGTSLVYQGEIIPNTELGHLELDGADAELSVANSAREREGLSFDEWAKRLTRYFSHLEKLFSPDVFVIGGGVSKQHDEFFHLIDVKTPCVPAHLLNNAGIVGSALYAVDHH
jgi:polyphosphate glucokinase